MPDYEYTAKGVANFFLDLGWKVTSAITPLKIQKLVYISHGWHLAITDGYPLVFDEYAEAWPYGPVFPSLYHEFKVFGYSPITKYAEEVVPQEGAIPDYITGEGYDIVTPNIHNEEVKELLNQIWDFYRDTSGSTLSQITHKKGSPWEKVWNKHGGKKNAYIPDEDIKIYYQGLMNKDAD